MAEADRAWMIDTLLALLQTPSPSGRTDAVMQLIGDIFDDFGVPFYADPPRGADRRTPGRVGDHRPGAGGSRRHHRLHGARGSRTTAASS